MDRKSLDKMSEIEEFLDSILDWKERGALHFDMENVTAMHAYASALAHWEENDFNSDSFMSTDNELLLVYSDALVERFGLPILNKEDGEMLERILMERKRVMRRDVSKDFLN